MSKELKALDSIMVSLAEYKEYAIDKLPTKAKEIREENDDDFLIIETALKRLELLESNQIFIERAKKLKALEIIKDKRVDIGRLYAIMETYPKKYQLECYNDEMFTSKRYFLTQEEYDLLKEILK